MITFGGDMKKLLLVVMCLFLFGCAGVKQSEYMKHSSHYKTWSHMKFSLWGYKNTNSEDLEKSKQENWWGIGYVEKSYARH